MTQMARNGIIPLFHPALLSLKCLLFLWTYFSMVTGYNNTVNQTSIACNRTTVTFALDSDSYLVKEFFYNCIPLPTKPLCGSFGKIYVQNYLNNSSELYSLDHQAPDYYPINVDFHRYNLTAQSIGSNGYEEAEMIQVPIVAVPYAPNRTVDFFDGPAVLLWNSSFPFFVNCLWTSQVYDNSSPLGVGPGGNGGGQTGTVPGDRAVAITMAPRDGGGSGMVYQGDAVRCEEQNYNNDYARCPNVPLEAPSLALGIHSMKVSSQSYYFDFNAFTLDGTGTNLTIDCWIQICVDPAACQNACWDAGHSILKENVGSFNEKIGSKIEGIITSKQITLFARPRAGHSNGNTIQKTSVQLWLLCFVISKTVWHSFLI